jgi:hypothetical protein
MQNHKLLDEAGSAVQKAVEDSLNTECHRGRGLQRGLVF